MEPEVLIAGAGIGGLTAALTLHAHGIHAAVIDSAHELKPLGVGINLLPHAVRELAELDLYDDLARVAVAPAVIAFFDADGRELVREPRGIEGGYGWPQYSVHRGALQMLLLTAVRERIGPDAVRTGAALVEFEQTGDDVTAHTTPGDVTAELMVGADGVHSSVRAQLHPESDPLQWSGVRMWRGAATMAPFLDGRTMAIVKGEGGVELITYPIGNGLVNWVVQVRESSPRLLPGDAGWNVPGDPEVVLSHLSDWRLEWLDLDALITGTDVVLEYPMVDRDPLPHWGIGRVTLLGDAAHPMYPVGANGGSQAIVDARVLARELSRNRAAGLRTYENQRLPATTEIVAANRDMLASGATRCPDEIADAARKYRIDTDADRGNA